MKLLVVLFFIFGVCTGIYLFITYFFLHIKYLKKINKKALVVSASIGLVLLVLLSFAIYKSATAPDTWCSTIRNSTNYPPVELRTAADYFEKGNYDYDTGRCKEAVADYTKSIALNSKYPQAFNNRAYTYMRMGDYKNALADLNSAIALDPNYINALMNRGDIHNYYFEVDKAKAIADYEKIISIAGTSGTGVCGHLSMAKHASKNLLLYFMIPFEVMNCRGGI